MKNKLDILKEKLTDADTYRYILGIVFFYGILFYGIQFMNAGNSYAQAMAFRSFCVAVALLILTFTQLRFWFHFGTLLYLPVCYFGTRIAYERHWIQDICEYQFVDVIRLGKLVILLWGILLIGLARELIRNQAWRNIKQVHPILGSLWAGFVLWTAIFQREYFYINFFLLGFTTLFWSLNQKEKWKKQMLQAFTDAMLLSFFYISYKTLMHRPYDTERYQAYFSNSNVGGMYFASAVVVLFFRIHLTIQRARKGALKSISLVLQYLLLGFAICLALYNYTRTTILGLGFAFLTGLVVELITAPKKKKIWLKYGMVILVVIALFQPTYQAIRYIPAKMDAPFYFDGEYNPERKVLPGEPIDSPKYVSMNQYLRIVFGKWGIYINFEEREEAGETTVEVDAQRDVTNGRVEIWKTYLSHTNATGHYPGHLTMDSGYFCYHAHSTYFHILYQYGLVGGILFALLAIFGYGLSIYYYIRKGKKEPWLLFPLLMTATCLIGQVTEWMGHPAYVICFSYMLSLGLLMTEKRES